MAPVSGFDPLFDQLQTISQSTLVSCYASSARRPPRLVDRFASRLARAGKAASRAVDCQPPSPFVKPDHERAGQRLLALAEQQPSLPIILAAAENQLGGVLAGSPRALKSRLIACFHQPPFWLRLNWRDFSLFDDLGGIVCLSESQQEFFSSITSTAILKIRHGVRHDYFVPDATCRAEPPRLICVGHWLRDFPLLNAAMQNVWHTRPDIELDCVVPWSQRGDAALWPLARDRRVRWHAGLDAERLRSLYQQASVCLLPLVDATANNSILEALACGLPVVSTAVGGVGEYVPEGCGTLCPPGSAEAHASAALAWVDADARRRRDALEAARSYAESGLDWLAIAREFAAGIDSLVPRS